MIQRLIVESFNGVCVVNQPLDRRYSEAEVRAVLEAEKLPVISLDVDTVGTALVVIGRNYYSHAS